VGGGGGGEREREKWHFGSVRGVVRLPFGTCATFLCNWTSPLLHSKKRCICFTKSQKPHSKASIGTDNRHAGERAKALD
jgi:hypothetical protein